MKKQLNIMEQTRIFIFSCTKKTNLRKKHDSLQHLKLVPLI